MSSLTLTLQEEADGNWSVMNGGDRVALIAMSALREIQTVVLFTDDAGARTAILKLCAHYDARFDRHGDSPFRHLLATGARADDPDAWMSFDQIPAAFEALDDGTLVSGFGTRLMRAEFNTFGEFLAYAAGEVKRLTGKDLMLVSGDRFMPNEVRVTVSAEEPFTIWKDVDWSIRHPTMNYHLVPGYHPSHAGTREVMVNGATGAIVWMGRERTNVIRRVAPPPEAVRRPSGHWEQLAHPYRATGRSFEMTVNTVRCLSRQSGRHVLSLLLAAVQHEGRYIGVDGGWEAPLPHPANITSDVHLIGSEASCVWEHRTLEAEGQLADARVPEFFTRERWLDRYRGYSTP